MFRSCTAVAVAVLFAGGAALAQSHPQGHQQGAPHGPGHTRPGGPMDPALHALLHSGWTGTLTTHKHESEAVSLKVAADKTGQQVVQMTGAKSLKIGSTKDLSYQDQKLRWRQEMSGKTCDAVADVIPARPDAPDTMKGTMSCGSERLEFTLTKNTK